MSTHEITHRDASYGFEQRIRQLGIYDKIIGYQRSLMIPTKQTTTITTTSTTISPSLQTPIINQNTIDDSIEQQIRNNLSQSHVSMIFYFITILLLSILLIITFLLIVKRLRKNKSYNLSHTYDFIDVKLNGHLQDTNDQNTDDQHTTIKPSHCQDEYSIPIE